MAQKFRFVTDVVSFSGTFLWRKRLVQITVFVYTITIHNAFYSELISCMGYVTLCREPNTKRNFVHCLK